MINISDRSNCFGCTACLSVCTRGAITMQPDTLGFLYPEVNQLKCVDCGMCERVCPLNIPKNHDIKEKPQSYLARHKDNGEVLKSKSGALFVALSDAILNEGGVIYGAQFDRNHVVKHASAKNARDRDRFRGSKYIQSDLGNVFKEIKEDLHAGHNVLFSGTSCQIAGLKAYIGSNHTDNLYLVDIFCHGVASPRLWEDYIRSIEKKKKKKISRCIPRNHEFGWYNNVDTFIFEDGSRYNSDFFTGYVYHKWISQRLSCASCPFASINRISDISLGDAWGADKVAPDFDPENIGSSIVVINSEKGRSLFERAKVDLVETQVDIDDMMQPVLKHPTPLHPKRKAFEESYAKYGFSRVRRVYLNNSLMKSKEGIIRMLINAKRLMRKL